ncbi:C39 family peptidase [Lactobacillus xylocopicola]|uniref:Peptidase C39-like domain-containing protein n=1 Tax=Lactobacillus xylocopicola TaxID=2976676 RepID=A0ABM8BI90_9LACO|nr:C39 family peptidase [Lactobacillus xylocopicola]BDR61027.1 hypothetical protein KIM322_12880 [Lactobacillus xylocopicola]
MKTSKLVKLSLLVLGIGLVIGIAPANRATIKSARNYSSRIVRSSNWKLWAEPYTQGSPTMGTTKSLAGKLMQLDKVATTKTGTYFQISRRGRTYGWVNAGALTLPAVYKLPYTYTSQLYPVYAPNGCEAASLKMALSVKGLASKTDLRSIIAKMPRAARPTAGFNGDPYTKSQPGEIRTIYPGPLTNYAKTYTKLAANLSGAGKQTLITEIKRGNPVIFAGTLHMQQRGSYHVLTLVGYQPGRFLVADPYMKKSSPNKVFWVSTSKFMQLYRKQHSRAVVIR